MAREDRLYRATENLLAATVHAKRTDSLIRLAEGLSASLGVRYAMVGELVDGKTVRVRALSGCAGKRVPQAYDLAGTPCEKAAQNGFYHHRDNAQYLFPTDPLLRCLDAQSYLGIPLIGIDGEVMGLLAALHDDATDPIDDLEDILLLFGTRASAELERLRAEEGLAESEARYRFIVNTCQEGIWWLDRSGRTTFVNGPMATMLGYQAEDLVGQPLSALVHRSQHARPTLAWMQEFAADVVNSRDLCLLSREGEEVWTAITSSPTQDREGRFTGVLAFVTNVSERRALEKRALHAQKMQSIGLLAGGVAHDFNNLLLGIMGRAELARSQLAVDHPAAEAMLAIENTVERAGDLTRQLLAYAGKSQVRAKLVDLGAVVDEMTALLSTAISKKAEIIVKQHGPALVFGDPSQLDQVVMNLIVNAGDALEQKPGTISIETGVWEHVERRTLSTTYIDDQLGEGEYAYLTVRDSGRGMDAATRERIFEPFFSTKTSGRGLGLAAVIGILRQHRGAVRVDSEFGKGTAFTVLLPTATLEQKAASSLRPAPASSVSTHGGLVLVADDEGMARSTCKIVLEKAGYRVSLAEDGREAVAKFKQHAQEICAVVLDRSMPYLSGEQVYVEILALRPDMPVVVSSGYAEQDMLELFQGTAPLAFLTKPWRGVDLLRALDGVLKQGSADRVSLP